MEQLTPYQAARIKEDTLRLETWLNPKVRIGPFLVNQMTPYHYIALELTGNEFINGGIPTETSLAEFLWILSNDYSKPQRFVWLRNWSFAKKLRKALKRDTKGMLDAVREYMENVTFDQPMSSKENNKKNKEPYTSWVATYVHCLCPHDPTKAQYVLHMPLNQLFQLVRASQVEAGIPMMNYLSEKAKQQMRGE
jgi:hypothetical protein